MRRPTDEADRTTQRAGPDADRSRTDSDGTRSGAGRDAAASRDGAVAALHRAVGNGGVQELAESERDGGALPISEPDGAIEREAERAAEAVLERSASAPPVTPRAEPAGEGRQRAGSERLSGRRGDVRNADAREAAPHRSEATAAGARIADAATASRIRAVRGTGRPLPERLRDAFEPRFGADFGDVRVATGGLAHRAARAVDAAAFTLGRTVAFRTGAFRPDAPAGRRLVAHELAHVVQQRGSADQVARARYPVPADGDDVLLHVVADYGDVVDVPPEEYADAVAAKAAALTGREGAVDADDLEALSRDAREWVLFALDLLEDNGALGIGLDPSAAIDRIVAHAPSARERPLGETNRAFVDEALAVSGWYEVALGTLAADASEPVEEQVAKIKRDATGLAGAVSGTTGLLPGEHETAREIVTPDTETSSEDAETDFCDDTTPGSLNESCLDEHLGDLLQRRWATPVEQKRANHPVEEQRDVSEEADVDAIAELVQREAEALFAPYATAGRGSAGAAGWDFSERLVTTSEMEIDDELRLQYLRNRAHTNAGDLLRAVNYDGSQPGHLDALNSRLEAFLESGDNRDLVDASLREISRTEDREKTVLDATRDPQSQVRRLTTDSQDQCRALWRVVHTMAHELLHQMTHEEFHAYAHETDQHLFKEGFAELLGSELSGHLLERVREDEEVRRTIEGDESCSMRPSRRSKYPSAVSEAENLLEAVGRDRFLAAFFLGRLELVGVDRQLRVGSVDHPREREADRAARAAMQQSEGSGPADDSTAPDGDRTASGPAFGRTVGSSTGDSRDGTPPVAALRPLGLGTGRELPASVRAFFEPRFGASFGDVGIHTGAAADAATRAVDARAFTLGTEVAFRAGEYRPETAAGRRLLAHELAHVLQQREGAADRLRRQPAEERGAREAAGERTAAESTTAESEPSEPSEYRRRYEASSERRDGELGAPLEPTRLDEDGAFGAAVLHYLTFSETELEGVRTGPLVLEVLERSSKFVEMAAALDEYYGREETPNVHVAISARGTTRFEPGERFLGEETDVILIGGEVRADPENKAVDVAESLVHETAHAYRRRVDPATGEHESLESFVEDEQETRRLETETLREARDELAAGEGERSAELAAELTERLEDPPSTDPRSIKLDVVSGTDLTYAEYYLLDGAIEAAEERLSDGRPALRALDEFFRHRPAPHSLARSDAGASTLLAVLERNAPLGTRVGAETDADGGDGGGAAPPDGEGDREPGDDADGAAEAIGDLIVESATEVAETVSRATTPLSAATVRELRDLLAGEPTLAALQREGSPPSDASPAGAALFDYVTLFRLVEIRERIEREREEAGHGRDDDAFVEQASRFAADYLGRPGLYESDAED